MNTSFRRVPGDSLTSAARRSSDTAPSALLAEPSPEPGLLPGDGTPAAHLGTDGSDRFAATALPELFDGGGGADWVSYADSKAAVQIDLLGGSSDGGFARGDTLAGIENVEGSAFGDLLAGDDGRNALTGLKGADVIHGNGGNDTIRGGASADFLTGEDGRDRIYGGAGNDSIDAGSGEDIISGGPGSDTIYGGPDPDVICYNFAADEISFRYDGSDYSLRVRAPDGADHIFTALTIATTTGTYRFDVPEQAWIYDPGMTTADWLGLPL